MYRTHTPLGPCEPRRAHLEGLLQPNNTTAPRYVFFFTVTGAQEDRPHNQATIGEHAVKCVDARIRVPAATTSGRAQAPTSACTTTTAQARWLTSADAAYTLLLSADVQRC